MKFFSLIVLSVAVIADAASPMKRGVQEVSAPAAATYTKLQQPLTRAQPQYYSLPQQVYAAQPQAQVAYTQPRPQLHTAAYRPQFSLATDVSSFQYSSPLVSYNNLGLLNQVVGRVATAPKTSVGAAAAPVAYQAPVSYAPAPARLSQPQYQQYVAAQSQAQAYSQAAAQSAQAAPAHAYSSAPTQAYSATPAQAYAAQSAPQAYTSQSASHFSYSQAPQYYASVPQGAKQSGVAYAQ